MSALFSKRKTKNKDTKSFPNYPYSSLVDTLQIVSQKQPQKRIYTYLNDGENDAFHITWKEMDEYARCYGAYLQEKGLRGERVLLLYPQSYSFIIAFWGCLYAGAIAIPAYPPKINRSLLRLKNIIDDSYAKLVITTNEIFPRIEKSFTKESWMNDITWDTHERIMEKNLIYRDYKPGIDDIAFLQYTSGSTGSPKGVMVSHRNLLANCQHIKDLYTLDHTSTAVHWLPVFHDMGLVFGVLSGAYSQYYSVLMPPVTFIQKPIRWLKAFQKYKGTMGGAPDFAYELLANAVTEGEKQNLDLSSIVTLYSGAEPVRKSTYDSFYQAFKNFNLKETSLYPTYGMAETTLVVCGNSIKETPIYITIDKKDYQKNTVKVINADAKNGITLASVGKSKYDMVVKIVDPETLLECEDNVVGEIWISGTSIAKGYWNKPELTKQTFEAYIASTGEGPFLRTGDLGFYFDTNLYISGRIKDLIIIHGANYYPQDIELAVELSHKGIQAGNTAAFSIEVDDKEKLVVIAEMRRTSLHNLDETDVTTRIREAIFREFELLPYAIILIRTMSIPKTTSGKIQRRACKQEFLQNRLNVVGEWWEETLLEEENQEYRTLGYKVWFQNWIEKKMKIPVSRIDFYKPVTCYPFDSITAIELEADLDKEFGIKILAQDLFEVSLLNDLLMMIESKGSELK